MNAKLMILSVIALVLLVTTAAFAAMYYSVQSADNEKISQLRDEVSSLNSTNLQLSAKLSAINSSLQGTYAQSALAAAMAHWNYIAIENTTLIDSSYSPSATLRWVGGPLTGTYLGISEISAVWTKFTNLYETVYWYTVVPPTVSQVNSSYYSVSAPVQFLVAPSSDPENVFVLNVTENLLLAKAVPAFTIVSEVWSVKPITLQSVISGYPGQPSLIKAQLLADGYSHWNDISIENVTLISQQYSPNAELTWIGGPLHGNYTGLSQIAAVWNKFSNAYEYVLWYAEVPPTVSVTGTTATVSGTLQFLVFPFSSASSPSPKAVLLNVNETLTYQYNVTSGTWLIAHEIWKVTPTPLTSAAPGYQPPSYS
ncbi:MAG: hypothetical protein RAK25_01110 [TACK group archaeon]|nr:hypothetical protein [TACK group archaeon]